MATFKGIPLSKVSPAFLHANSTSHTWVFSAFAELIDNAYDPDVSASELLIDKVDIRGVPCVIFLDNGAGVDREQLLKMLSFGFCEKDIYEKQGSHQPIGHYGNGFKSGSMRIGQDALVFTRCQKSASIGFLSQTFLSATKSDSVVVPILEYRLPSLERIKSQESRNNLNAILQFSVFKLEEELKEELKALEGSKTGTKIIISNLRKLQGSNYELDFSSDPRDIRCPEAHEVDMTSVYHRPIQNKSSEYKRSLREYCSILFLRPRMKITIRGVRVKSKLISKSLSNTEIDMYKPTWLSRPVKIIFGFTCEKGRAEDFDYGMMLYHRNRLIKAFEKVGYQKQPNGLGVGVVGVVQVDFLQPIHNKQDFNKDEKFNSVMAAFANKLNDYWNEKKGSNGESAVQSVRHLPDWLWAQCDHCLKWRRLPDEIDPESLPDLWYCRMNPDATHNRCDIPEEPEDEDLAVRPTYEKTFKKKLEEKKRLQVIEREKEEEAKRRKIMQKEQELKEKEATLRAIQRVAATQPENKTVAGLQKALADVRRKEEHQKRLILQIQLQKKLMEDQRNSLLQMAESLQAADEKNSKDVLEKMSKYIGTLNPNSTPTPSAFPGKRKINEETPSTPKISGKKKMCIKTETGEMLSITQNDIDSGDNDDIDSDPDSSLPASSKQSNGKKDNTSRTKTETAKNSSTISPSKPLQSSPDDPRNPFTRNGKQTVSTSKSPVQTIEAATEHTDEASLAPTARRKQRRNGMVMAVIDLTSESEFGELVDIKPDLEGLRAAVLENLLPEQADLKPDKDVLDEAISQKGDSNKQKATVPPLTEAKQEIGETSFQNETTASSTKVSDLGNSNCEVTDIKADDKVKINFGPSEDDPEFPMDIPKNFQENLEAAIAAIQERMEREKQEQENKNNNSLIEVENAADVSKGESNDGFKTEAFGTLKLQENSDLDLSVDGISEDASFNLKISEDEQEKEEKGKEDTSAVLEMKDDGGDDNSDFDGLIDDDDSDYRDYSSLYEKGDSGEPHIDRKKCDGAGESRNSSIEDGGGSSNQGISDEGESSVKQENEESPDGCHTEAEKQGEMSDSLVEETNFISSPKRKAQCELQNREESDSSESLTREVESAEGVLTEEEENVEGALTRQEGVGGVLMTRQESVEAALMTRQEIVEDVLTKQESLEGAFPDSLTNEENIVRELSHGQEKNSTSSLQVGARESTFKKSMAGLAFNFDEDCGDAAHKDAIESTESVINKMSLPHADSTHESSNNLSESGNLITDQFSDQTEAYGVQNNSHERFRSGNNRQSQSDSAPASQQSLSSSEDPSLSLSPHQNLKSQNVSPSLDGKTSSKERIQANVGNHKTDVADEVISKQQQASVGDDDCVFDKKLGQYCDLNRTYDECIQTDLNMSSGVNEIFGLKEEDEVWDNDGVDNKNKLLSGVEKTDKSFQISDIELKLSAANSQTEEMECNLSGDNREEVMEELQTELSLKSQRLEEVDKKLTEIHVNIHKLLGILVPGTELGDVANVDQIITDMIRVHEDSFQQSESQASPS